MQPLKLLISSRKPKSLANYFTLPNITTGVRVILSPVLLYTLLSHYWVASFVICFTAGITDWFDGYFARKYNQSTPFGQYFDPIADKILMTFSYIGLGMTGLVPVFLCVLIIVRDILIASGGVYVVWKEIQLDLTPSLLSKINTGFQIALIGYTVFIQFLHTCGVEHPVFSLLHFMLILLTCLTTLFSGIHYGQHFATIFKKSSKVRL